MKKSLEQVKKNIQITNSNQRGITLVALVITIIVLLILAGVTISLVLGENGIFQHAQNAKEAYKIGEITEKLQLAKVPVQLDNRGMTVIDKYLDEIIKEGIITEGDIEETGDENSRYITVEGKYVYLIEEKNKDVEITYQGKLGKLLPNLLIEVVDIQSTSISIKANATRMEKGEYTYYIKNITKKEEYVLKGTSESNEYTFSGLEPDNQYQIKVDARNANGTTTKETQIITTVKQMVTGVKLNKETVTFNIGDKETLTATIEPENASNKNVIWSSTNEEIVSVDNGEITAVSSGTAKITAEAADGSGKKATCTVTVIQQGTVSYHIDTGNTQTQVYNYGEDALSPSFTPEKSGYTFVGWKEDMTADASVLTAKEVNADTINLYAVFKKDITVTKYNGSATATQETKQQYYNNGTIANPSFTLTQNTISGWSALGWATSNEATAGIAVNNGGSVTLESNATYYGRYSRTITLSYNGNGATGGSTTAQTGTRHFNSAGNYSNPSFTLKANGFSRTNYAFQNWAMGSASGTKYNAGASVTLSDNTTFYATWKATSVRAFTFSSDSNHVNSSVTRNARYIQFGTCGYVGSGVSIQNDTYGQSIRLVTSRAGKLRFVLNAQNYTGANLTSNCAIEIANDFVYAAKIQPNQSVSIDMTFDVAAGIIINIANNGQNGDMWIKAGSYIEWVN